MIDLNKKMLRIRVQGFRNIEKDCSTRSVDPLRFMEGDSVSIEAWETAKNAKYDLKQARRLFLLDHNPGETYVSN